MTEAVKRGKKATFLALRLAEKVFGYDVMVESTITGREGTERLDNEKLMAIRGDSRFVVFYLKHPKLFFYYNLIYCLFLYVTICSCRIY